MLFSAGMAMKQRKSLPLSARGADFKLKIYTFVPPVYREACGYQALAIRLCCSVEGLSLRTLEVPLGFFFFFYLPEIEDFMRMVLFVMG